MTLKNARSLLALLATTCMGGGCAGTDSATVPLLPNGSPAPRPCPPGAIEAMRKLEIAEGDVSFAVADATEYRQIPARLMDGPVVGYSTREVGLLPERTRLYGRVWTAGPEVVIRYHEVGLPDGRRFPICAVAMESFGGLEKLPGSAPGVAVVQDSRIALRFVDVYP